MTPLDAFTTRIQRLYCLERELVTVLDVLALDISTDSLDDLQTTDCRKQLQDRVETHRDETESHVEHLEEVLDTIGESPNTHPTPELDGWIADKEQFNNIILNDKLRPLYYLDATKKLEEIERSAYEPVLALAKRLENENENEIEDIAASIDENAEEERRMLDDLESLADSESVEMLLETSPVDPANRSSLDRLGGDIETLEDVFICQLQNIYYIELILTDLFDEMAMGTTNNDLGETFIDQYDQTQIQVDRLEQVFEAVDTRLRERRNHTFDGLVESWRNRLESTDNGSTDLFYLETALAAERIKSRCYEELLTLGNRIGYSDDVIELLTANHPEQTIQSVEAIEFEDLIEESPESTSD